MCWQADTSILVCVAVNFLIQTCKLMFWFIIRLLKIWLEGINLPGPVNLWVSCITQFLNLKAVCQSLDNDDITKKWHRHCNSSLKQPFRFNITVLHRAVVSITMSYYGLKGLEHVRLSNIRLSFYFLNHMQLNMGGKIAKFEKFPMYWNDPNFFSCSIPI